MRVCEVCVSKIVGLNKPQEYEWLSLYEGESIRTVGLYYDDGRVKTRRIASPRSLLRPRRNFLPTRFQRHDTVELPFRNRLCSLVRLVVWMFRHSRAYWFDATTPMVSNFSDEYATAFVEVPIAAAAVVFFDDLITWHVVPLILIAATIQTRWISRDDDRMQLLPNSSSVDDYYDDQCVLPFRCCVFRHLLDPVFAWS